MKNITAIIMLFLLFSCNQRKKEVVNNIEANTLVKYAKGFEIEEYNNYYKLIIKTPYQNSNDAFEYILTKGDFDTTTVKNTVHIIQIPVKRIVATSTTHIPMIEALEEENSLIGFPNMRYISSVKTRKLIDSGVVKEIGIDANLNTEIVIDLNPDLIIGFSVSASNKSLEALKRTGIPVIYNGAWLEETPLGRAEWIKFFGVLYNKIERADSIFKEIEKNYLQIKNIASKKKNLTTVISGSMFKDVWNVPAGESFVAQFLKDANTDYLWKDTKGTGSLNLNFENVLDNGQMADLWIGPGSLISKEEMLNSNLHYGEFKAFKTDNMYTFSKKKGATGGTIYYELGALRPDLILKDIIKIAHPELLPEYTMIFFDKME